MSAPTSNPSTIPNGSGAAALLAAAIGCFVLAILGLVADKSPAIAKSLNIYKPTGPLSGVTTVAIVAWFLVWGFLQWRWRQRTVAMGRINGAALALLLLGMLLVFPPIVDLL